MLCGKLWFTWLSYSRPEIGLKLKNLFYVPESYIMFLSEFCWFFRLFWAQKALATLVASSGPKKVSIIRFLPPEMALVMDIPPSKPLYVPNHINNRYINSYQTSRKRKNCLCANIFAQRAESNVCPPCLYCNLSLVPEADPSSHWPPLWPQVKGEVILQASGYLLENRMTSVLLALHLSYCKHSPNAVM